MKLIDAGYVMKAINRHLKHPPVGQYEAGFNDGLNTAILEIMAALSQTNEPLTLDELREMDGQPVFLETGEVSIREQLIAEWEILITHNSRWFFFTRRKNGFHTKDYGKTWFAYRRPPEGEGST